ncbi:unnamed protein product [Danaus chrysippus]|uniref:(African queen) hypothetical protein n=1 Tax=Danaus chrysippus TaxID=151541 RepID=A0A8J2QLW8_9NEOP|nr:unnamed protein product [Danaus chrysippus]
MAFAVINRARYKEDQGGGSSPRDTRIDALGLWEYESARMRGPRSGVSPIHPAPGSVLGDVYHPEARLISRLLRVTQ